MNLVIDADRRFHNRTIALLRLSRNETQRSHPTGDSAPKAALITRFRGFTSDGMNVAIIEWDLQFSTTSKTVLICPTLAPVEASPAPCSTIQ